MNPVLAHTSPSARILIVDDEPDNRELLQVILNWEGFLTSTASSGEEALLSALREPPDLMLLDLMMPGLDGYDVTVRLKENPATSAVPVLIISAIDDRAVRARVLGVGASGFVSKPIDRAELCRLVRSTLSATGVAAG